MDCIDPARACGDDDAPEPPDTVRRSAVAQTREDERAPSMELRSSAAARDDNLPEMAAAFPPPPPRAPPPSVLRPDEYRQEYASCGLGLACAPGPPPSECLGCGEACGLSLFSAHARCFACGAAFCGSCKHTGLQRVGPSGPFACGEETGYRCADEVACETQPHALRLVRSYWGGPPGVTGLEEAVVEEELLITL